MFLLQKSVKQWTVCKYSRLRFRTVPFHGFHPRPLYQGRLAIKSKAKMRHYCQYPSLARGVTHRWYEAAKASKRLNPRSSHERQRSVSLVLPFALQTFQSSPSREGRRLVENTTGSNDPFQSTPLAGGTTANGQQGKGKAEVSIHTPRAWGDAVPVTLSSFVTEFQSTPLARGATFSVT